MSTEGDGGSAIPLLATPALTDANGQFEISSYTCPSPSSQLYLVSLGGNPGLPANFNNPNLAEMSLLGPCAEVTASAYASINEITTVAASYALAPFMKGYAEIGSDSADAALLEQALVEANELANFATGQSPGPGLLLGQVAPVAKLRTLADVLATCVNSFGGTAGDGSVCGDLFSYATGPQVAPPTNTIDAILRIAQNPARNVDPIYFLADFEAPFQPMLSTPPLDWTLSISSPVATPSLLPSPGSYTGPQAVSLADATPSARIYYTVDGSVPTTSSPVYSGPIDVTSATTIRAIAVANGVSSLLAWGTYAIAAPQTVNVAVTPVSVAMVTGQTQQFTASVTGSANTSVTWTVRPALGSISPGGLYSSPASLSVLQTVTVTATSSADGTKSASATVSVAPAPATYYLSPFGLDTNSGTSSSAPWLTPQHAVRCGDTILAAASSSYSADSFGAGRWGTVVCPAGNNVAWLKCVTFDACKIRVTSGTSDGMRVTASFWGVQGWEVSNTSGGTNGGNCFNAVPASATQSIHHILFANNIANVCPLDGFSMGPNGAAGVDYWAAVGNIAYHAGTSNMWCGSGISAYEPVATDNLPGTHLYVAGNLSYANVNPPGCFDGNGIIFDTFDGDQTSMPVSYAQQGVIDNNISLSNGAVGVRVEYNDAGNGPGHASIYVRHNTVWNNSGGTYQYGNPTCAEVQLYKTVSTQAFLNLAASNQPGCYGDSANPEYVFSANQVDASSSFFQNFGWSAAGFSSQIVSSPAFSFGTGNMLQVNPLFAHAAVPAAPNCSTASSVPACMATVISNFTPLNPSAAPFGFQIPGAAPTYDPLFPQWLCTTSLPAGLVSMGCLAQP